MSKFNPLLLATLALLFGCQREPAQSTQPARIIALSPGLTETVCALGNADQIVGIPEYTRYPPAIAKRPVIGGFSQPNTEAIIALKPTLVFGIPSQADTLRTLERLGIQTQTQPDVTLVQIRTQMLAIGETLNRPAQAAEIVEQLDRAIAKIAELPAQKILISVSRTIHNQQISECYVAGRTTLFGEIIHRANSTNAYTGGAPYAKLGREALLRLNPQLIIELAPDASPEQQVAIEQAWKSLLPNVPVALLSQSFISIPGPRIDQTIDAFATALKSSP